MNTEFIDSFRRPKLHGDFIMDLNPFSKLNLCALIAAFAGVIGGVASSVVAILLYIAITAAAGCLKKFWGLFWKVGALLFFFIFMIRSAFWPGTTLLFEWWIVHWTVEGMENGLWFALLVIQICGAVMLFYNITPMKDLMYAIEMLGVSHSASFVVLSAMQTITDLGKTANVIMDSQSARGIETTGNLKTRFKAFIPILGPLVLGAIGSTEEKTIAMETRAFSSHKHTTHIYELRKTPLWEKAGCILLDIAFVAALVWRIAA